MVYGSVSTVSETVVVLEAVRAFLRDFGSLGAIIAVIIVYFLLRQEFRKELQRLEAAFTARLTELERRVERLERAYDALRRALLYFARQVLTALTDIARRVSATEYTGPWARSVLEDLETVLSTAQSRRPIDVLPEDLRRRVLEVIRKGKQDPESLTLDDVEYLIRAAEYLALQDDLKLMSVGWEMLPLTIQLWVYVKHRTQEQRKMTSTTET